MNKKRDIMYNLNVNVSSAGTAVNNLLAVENACTTPRTPEILNSLIAMTNPLDGYNFNSDAPKSSSCPQNVSNDSNSSSSQGDTPTATSPPSVQHTCSQLIKAGLKLSIESKRKHSPEHDDLLDLDANAKRVKKNEDDLDGDRSRSPNQGLTPEDEERRRRRRERNKIAATKCRLKKREKTVNLVHESEILETQNIDLKTQIQELEQQRRRLVDMLSMHSPSCVKHTNNGEHFVKGNGRYITREEMQNFDLSLPPVTSLATPVNDTNAQYNRNLGITTSTTDSSYNNIYSKPPTIIVEGDTYSPPSQITNLDSGIAYYSTQQCHNYSPNSSNQSYGSPTMDNGCMA